MSQRCEFGYKQSAQILNGADGKGAAVTTGTPVVSNVVPCFGATLASFQLIAPATLAGTWLIEESNDYSATPNGPVSAGRWTDVRGGVDFSGATPPAIPAASGSTAQNVMVRLPAASRRGLRITFTRTSGTGVPEVWATATQA